MAKPIPTRRLTPVTMATRPRNDVATSCILLRLERPRPQGARVEVRVSSADRAISTRREHRPEPVALGLPGPREALRAGRERSVASIEKRPDGRYRARWREYPGAPQKRKHFAKKAEAERFLDGI